MRIIKTKIINDGEFLLIQMTTNKILDRIS